MKVLVLGLILVYSVLAVGTVTTTNIDFASGDMCQQLTRVEKTVDVRYSYTTTSDHKWTQFPDMGIEFELEFPQYVDISYNIWTRTSRQSNFDTRVIIDQEENIVFRVSFANVWYHSNSIYRPVWMQAGKHRAQVEYRTDSGMQMGPNYDRHVGIFNIRYFKK